MDIDCAWDSLLDIDTIEQLLGNLFSDKGESVEGLLNDIYHGKQIITLERLETIITHVIFGEWIDLKNMFVMVLLIMIIGSILKIIGEIFAKNEIKEIAEYVMMIFLNTILMKGFMRTEVIVRNAADELLTFIKLLIPAYFVAVGSVSGMIAASGFYQYILLVIGLLEQVILLMIVPATKAFAMMLFMDAIVGGDHLRNISDLLEKAIILGLKAIISIVIGLGTIQSMITPVIGNINRSFLEKTISVIPGVGDISDSVTSVMLGSAVLIKNTIGAFGMVILILLCLTPICKIGLIGACMKIAAALGSVLGKSRLVQCSDRIGDSCFLMARVMLTVGALFFTMIAMIAFSTNRGI